MSNFKSKTDMKKTTLLAALALAGASFTSQAADEYKVAFNNPLDADGFMIVKYDLDKGAFAESNDWEIDETFVFALDVTGTPLEAALQTASRNPAVLGRGMAYDIYSTNLVPEGGTGSSIDGRLMHIKDNIYGMTLNIYQQSVSRYKDAGLVPNADFTEYLATTAGQVTEFDANFFGFGWSADNPGAEWWDGVAAPIQGQSRFRCAAYTGTKTSPEFTAGDVIPATECPFAGLDAGSFHSMVDNWGGYARPTAADFAAATTSAGIQGIISSDAAEVIATEYYDLMGRRLEAPAEKTVSIRRDILSNGKTAVSKVIR